MAKAVLVNPPSAFGIYDKSKIRATVPILPSLSLAMLAGSLKEERCKVSILDLALEKKPLEYIYSHLENDRPDFIGITATTPLFYEARDIIRFIRDNFGNDIKIIIGGPHVSALAEESLAESRADFIVMGEGELVIKSIIKDSALEDIGGICFSRDGKIYLNKKINLIEDLDMLPFPALELFDLKRYNSSRVIARRNPVGPIETSRGCVFNCSFCNKNIAGRRFRHKSPKRVLDEIKYILHLGFREIHILDDQFTTDLENAKEICELIIKEGLKFPWNLRTGIRVDRLDEEFLLLAKRAGCYQLGVGFESGNQESLDSVGKRISLQSCYTAARLIRKSGIECVWFFMLGLPNETEEKLKNTIRFAIDLDTDYAKATITVPFPGTELFDEYQSKGLIKHKDWSKYNFHNPEMIYIHPNLDWQTLKKYYNIFHIKFYLRAEYILKRFYRGFFNGRLFYDLYYSLKTFLPWLNLIKK